MHSDNMHVLVRYGWRMGSGGAGLPLRPLLYETGDWTLDVNRIPAVTSTLSMARKFCSVSQNAVCGAVRCGGAAVRRWHPRPRKSCASAYAACGATESAWCANMWAITRTRLLGGKSKWSDNYRRESSSSACATDGPVE